MSTEATPSTEHLKATESLQFAGKVILVTGANRPDGIGAATAREFARQGAAAVVISSRPNSESEKQAEGVVAELEDLGTQALWIPGDLRDPAVQVDLVKQVVEQAGGLNILVNNSGITRDGLAMMMSRENWDDVIATNLTAPFFVAREAAKKMRKTGGAIVNVSSVAGLFGNPGQANYAAAKAGLIGMTQSLATEWAQYGIRVNAVAPGFVQTSLTETVPDEVIHMAEHATPLGRLVTPDEVAQAIVHLAGPNAAMITGQVYQIDGGLGAGIRAIPGLQRAYYQISQK